MNRAICGQLRSAEVLASNGRAKPAFSLHRPNLKRVCRGDKRRTVVPFRPNICRLSPQVD
jgi:hypothetical protein